MVIKLDIVRLVRLDAEPTAHTLEFEKATVRFSGKFDLIRKCTATARRCPVDIAQLLFESTTYPVISPLSPISQLSQHSVQ